MDWRVGTDTDWQVGTEMYWQVGTNLVGQLESDTDWQVRTDMDWQVGIDTDWQIGADLVGQVDCNPWCENAAESSHHAAGSEGRDSVEEHKKKMKIMYRYSTETSANRTVKGIA